MREWFQVEKERVQEREREREQCKKEEGPQVAHSFRMGYASSENNKGGAKWIGAEAGCCA